MLFKNKSYLFVVALGILNIVLLYMLLLMRNNEHLIRKELEGYKNKKQPIDFIGHVTCFKSLKTEYALKILLPPSSCSTCIKRTLANANKLIAEHYRNVGIYYLGPKEGLKYLDIDTNDIEIIVKEEEEIFSEDLAFTQPVILLIRQDGVICDNLEVSVSEPDVSIAFFNKMKYFLN